MCSNFVCFLYRSYFLLLCLILILSSTKLLPMSLVNIHYNDVIMSAMDSQITSITIVYSIVNSGTDQRKHQSSASVAFVKGIYRWLLNSPNKGPENLQLGCFWTSQRPSIPLIIKSCLINYIIMVYVELHLPGAKVICQIDINMLHTMA